MSLHIAKEEKQCGIFVLALSGSLDTDTYEILERALTSLPAANTKGIILDMEGLVYISSMGLNVVFKAKSSMERNKGLFMMVNLQPQIKKVFEVVKAIPSMDIFESMEEADRYLAKIQSGSF